MTYSKVLKKMFPRLKRARNKNHSYDQWIKTKKKDDWIELKWPYRLKEWYYLENVQAQIKCYLNPFTFIKEQIIYNLIVVSRWVCMFRYSTGIIITAIHNPFRDFRNCKKKKKVTIDQLLKIRPKRSHTLLWALEIFFISCCYFPSLQLCS